MTADDFVYACAIGNLIFSGAYFVLQLKRWHRYQRQERRYMGNQSTTPEALWGNEPWLYELGGVTKRPLLDYWGDIEPDALKKSWDLLLEHLDRQQTIDLITTGTFRIVTAQCEVEVLASWNHVNIEEITSMGRIGLCTASKIAIPLWDHILAQVLMIKYDWPQFRQLAVSWRY